MKTTILAIILLLFSVSSLLNLNPESAFALEISPKIINLGEIQKNKVILQEIHIKNTESQMIILEKARSSCDCITLEYEKNIQLKKNETCKITLTLNTAELSEGKLKKFIFLSFQNTKTPIHSIEIKGNISTAPHYSE